MRLSRHSIGWIVGLMTAALGGLILLQVRLFRDNLTLQEEAFQRNVIAALNATTAKLEEIDLRDRFLTVQAIGKPPTGRRTQSDTSLNFVFVDHQNSLSTRLEGRRLSYSLGSPQSVSIRLYDVMGRLDTVLVESTEGTGEHVVHIPAERVGKGTKILQVKTDSASSILQWGEAGVTGYTTGGGADSLETVILRVAETFKAGKRPGLATRLRPEILDSVLAAELLRNHITLPAQYGVVDGTTDSLLLGDSSLRQALKGTDGFSGRLFADNFSGDVGNLVLRFPTYRSYLFREMLPELSLNVLFLALIVGIFWYTVRALVRQREFAGRVTDFINNMTHEFKTPLSTIALASEAIARPDVSRSKAKLNKFNAIIEEEYTRMKSQVDKILSMAALEEGDVEFHLEILDLHDMIRRTAEHASLDVKPRGGTLEIELKASVSLVRVDAVHMENIVRSIIDNAIKYSSNGPKIVVETGDDGAFLLVRVRDQGIGIAREHQQRVFEKYYRVPTGNVHDVKGFGLGLSYVKLIVEAFGGSVNLESRVGEGTTVELRIPSVKQ